MAASDFLEDLIRMHLMRTGTWAKSTARYFSLHTADPGDTGANEVSGGSYARVQRDAADANWTAGTPTDGTTDNVAAITFPSPSANWGLITHVGMWDAATVGNFMGQGPLAIPKNVNGGDAAPSFLAGALDVVVQ
jgi:hypothetical protein